MDPVEHHIPGWLCRSCRPDQHERETRPSRCRPPSPSGAAYTMGKLTVEADADWTFWHSYRSLPIDIKDNRPVVLPDSNAPKNWNDVVALRLGAEYRVTDPLALRAGFVYDPTPVPADTMGPELPDADRFNYMVGAGYKVGNVDDRRRLHVRRQDGPHRQQPEPRGGERVQRHLEPATPGWRGWTSGTSSKLTRGGEGPGGPSPRGIRARRVPFRSAARGSARTP